MNKIVFSAFGRQIFTCDNPLHSIAKYFHSYQIKASRIRSNLAKAFQISGFVHEIAKLKQQQTTAMQNLPTGNSEYFLKCINRGSNCARLCT